LPRLVVSFVLLGHTGKDSLVTRKRQARGAAMEQTGA
jgi:hypothetical protein